MDWSMIQSVGIALGGVSIGFGYLYGQFRGGTSKSASELIAILRVKDSEQKALIVDYQKKFENINKEIGILQGKLIERDRKVEELTSILQGRNPEQEEFMRFVIEVAGSSAKYMKDSAEILNEIKSFMKTLNSESQKHTEQLDKAAEIGAKLTKGL